MTHRDITPHEALPQTRPELVDLIWKREIDPGKVFDLELPLDQAAEG